MSLDSEQCDGHECYELIYDVNIISLHEFRITRIYLPESDSSAGCITPTESETDELMKKFENFVAGKLKEEEDSVHSKCSPGCECLFNGRFSEWSEWKRYPDDQVTMIAQTSRAKKNLVCEWKLIGYVKVRYRKKLGDCLKNRLFRRSAS